MRQGFVYILFLLFILGASACGYNSSDTSSIPLSTAEGQPSEEPPTSGDSPSDSLPVDDPPSGDSPSDGFPVDGPPSGDSPSGGLPVDDPPSGDSPSDGLPVDDPPSGDSPSDESETTQTASWELVLKVSVTDSMADTGVAYNRLVAGTDATATDGFDNTRDIRAFLAGPIQAYFVHTGETGYDITSQELWHDIRQAELPLQWSIEVIAASGREVILEWDLPEGEVSCATHQFILEDSDGQLGNTDMCAVPTLTFVGDGLMRYFMLNVS